jgi:phospholipid/cholesterol/gamma-HCH transport system substrate-binding protein
MAKPFKFRYVNEIVGGFVLLTIALLVGGVLLVGHYQEWFTPVHRVHLIFPPQGSLDLRKGSEVKILGAVVGQVERIKIEDDDSMSGEMSIKGDAFRFVRTDSRVIAKKQYAAFGDAYIDISKGSGARLNDGGKLSITNDTEIFEIAQQLLDQVRESVVPLLGQIRLTAEEYGGLAADLRSNEGPIVKLTDNLGQLITSLRSNDGPLMKIFADMQVISTGLKNGEGTAGRLLRDPGTSDEVNRILKQVGDTIAQVQKILEDVKKTSAQLPPMAARVGNETQDLPGLVLQTQETIRQTQRLIDGIQQVWPISSYIPKPEPTQLIPPSDIGSPSPAANGGKSP